MFVRLGRFLLILVQVGSVTAVCCAVVTVPIDQFKKAKELNFPVVQVISVLVYGALLLIDKLGPILSLLLAFLLELVSWRLLKQAEEKKKSGTEDKKDGDV